MLAAGTFSLGQRLRHILPGAEVYEHTIVLTPGDISEELVKSFAVGLCSAPEFTLRNEHVTFGYPKRDVGLAELGEGLAWPG